MRRLLTYLCALCFIFFLLPTYLLAFEKNDPQYIVINFSDSFHFLNWTAPEKEWQTKVKPVAKERLRRIKTLLSMGSDKRKLAWSTLMEYVNYPMDIPSDSSPYIIRMKRILELAEEEDFPVFIPLNGVQWWDELPELWNWWDFDGNQTPGCKNSDYKNCSFKKLQDPEYRKRFIAGYNPENKWNVDWENWTTPEKFALRNWGGGDIFVAPSPNLASHSNAKLTFRSVQKARYEKLLKTIYSQVSLWEQQKKAYLFAGVSIGTEITLNGALIPGDENFKPYGYRAVQDMFCPKDNKECGSDMHWSQSEITNMREGVIHEYVQDFAYTAFIKGFTKEKVYSHVWSEAEKGELRYMNAIGASITYFSQPGLSIYGKALDPLAFSLLKTTLSQNGYPAWAAPEFAPLNRDGASWRVALFSTLDNIQDPAKLINIYNESDIINTPAIPELKQILSESVKNSSCPVDLPIPVTPNRSTNPSYLSWDFGGMEKSRNKIQIELWKNSIPDVNKKKEMVFQIKDGESRFVVPPQLDNGYYYWVLKQYGCDENHFVLSTPRIFYIEQKLKEYPLPWWVKLLQKKSPRFL